MSEQPTKAEYLASLEPLSEQNSDCGDCLICYEVLTDATQTPCGHIFCLECLKLWVEGTQACNADCPACRAPLHAFEEASEDDPEDFMDLMDLVDPAEMEAEIETGGPLSRRFLQQQAIMNPIIIIQGSVLHALTHEYVQAVRDRERDLMEIEFGEAEDLLDVFALSFPDFMDELFEKDVRYAFYWRYSVMGFGFLRLTVSREVSADHPVLHSGDRHPMDELAGRVQDFFNGLRDEGMASIIVQRAIGRNLAVDVEYECQFFGPCGNPLEGIFND